MLALVFRQNRTLSGIVLLALVSLLSAGCGSSLKPSIATPTFSPASGTYPTATTVTISDATPGASIYYTLTTTSATTGLPVTMPTGQSLGYLYTGPFVVGVAETITAIATYQNLPFSPSATASYVVGVGAPTISPAGGTFTTIQSVAITDTTPNATIYYTLDGTTPTTASKIYAAPLSVGISETVNAIAVLTGTGTSPVSTASFVINLPTAATPAISPAAGTYTSIQTVTIADATQGVAIYYTLNGNTPTTASTLYAAAIQVGVTEAINAIAVETGYNNSAVATSAYTINLPPAPTPTFSPVAGTYTSIQSVAIADSAAGALIYYTLDGSTPTTASTPYTVPITVSVSETIKAIATATGYSTSVVGIGVFTINLPPAATPTFTPAPGTYTAAQTVTVSDSSAGAAIYYTLNGSMPTVASTRYTSPIAVSGTETINAIATAPGYSTSAVGVGAYTINLPPTATPTFSPVAGTYATIQTVTISDSATGAAIYYTVDGSTPTTSSTQYTVPISVQGTETVSAIALASGFSNSAVATAVYKITSILTGKVLAGTQAVTGSTVQLYVAGTGGYGLGSGSIATAAATTDSNGNFTLTFLCPSNTNQVYVVASGGNPGLAAGTNNPNLAMMATLGTCGTLAAPNPAASVTVNEVTTVAAVWALQQFMASPTVDTTQGVPMIGTSAATYGGVQAGVIGLQNAFGMVNNMVNVPTGSAAVPTNLWSTPETTKINTVADILYTCDSVNPATSTACTTLITDVTPSGKTKALDTIQAAWYMAQNPGNNVSTLYKLVTGTPPFTGLTAAPNDLTIAVNLAPTYTGASYTCGTTTCTTYYGVATPHHVAIDRYGNAWLSNNGSHSGMQIAAPTGTDYAGPGSSVVELAPNGSILMNPATSFTASTTGGAYSQFTVKPASNTISFSAPKMVAIDTSNNVWIANYGGAVGTPAAGSIGYFNGSTAAGLAGSVNGGYYVGGAPWGIAIDGHNNIYESNTTPTGLDALSVGKIVATTGSYTYSTSGGASPPNELPNVSAVAALGAGNWSAVLAVDTNTVASGGADGLLWTASPACVDQGQYDSTFNIAWGIVDIFDADTLGSLSGAEATTSFSDAIVGAGSATNCGSSIGTNAVAGTGLAINQIFTAAMSYPFGVAIDKNNGVWIADAGYSSGNLQGFNGLTYLAAPTSSTGVIPTSAYIVNGSPLTATQTLSQGQVQRESTYIEVDGNNNVWAASQGFGTIAEANYNATTNTITYLTPASGEGFAHTLATAYGMAIDASGNVWITNTSANGTAYYVSAQGPEIADGFSMTVMVGAAGPVVTPLAQAVQSNMLGQKP
jgi:hypothetical protein